MPLNGSNSPVVGAVECGTGRRPHARATAASAVGEAGGFNAVQKLLTNPASGTCPLTGDARQPSARWCTTVAVVGTLASTSSHHVPFADIKVFWVATAE